MARTLTNIIPLGYKAPAFQLPDTVGGGEKAFQDIKGKHATVVMFICNHCPFVVHIQKSMAKLAADYKKQGVGFVAISSNDVGNYPQDAPHLMKEFALSNNFQFPYLYDESQEVAKAYDAACTPDFSVFDANESCVYRGELDGSRPGNEIESDGSSIRKVLDLLIEGKEVPSENQKPSIGCNIKWKQDEV